MRLYSPRAQVHQQIVNEYQTTCSAFVKMAGNGKIVCDVSDINEALADKKTEKYPIV